MHLRSSSYGRLKPGRGLPSGLLCSFCQAPLAQAACRAAQYDGLQARVGRRNIVPLPHLAR